MLVGWHFLGQHLGLSELLFEFVLVAVGLLLFAFESRRKRFFLEVFFCFSMKIETESFGNKRKQKKNNQKLGKGQLR